MNPRILFRIFLGLAAILSSSCSSQVPLRENGPAPAQLAGRQLQFTDSHGINFYTFFADGRYRYATLSQNKTYADSREGRFTYKRSGSNRAEIRFADEPTIRLTFSELSKATGTIDGDQRTYLFRLE